MPIPYDNYRDLLANDQHRENTLWILRNDAWLAHFDLAPDHAEAAQIETLIQNSGHARPYDAVLTPADVQIINNIQQPLLYLIGNEYRRPVASKLNACISLIREAYWLMNDPTRNTDYARLSDKLSKSLPRAWPHALSAANNDKTRSPFDNTAFPSNTPLPSTPRKWLIVLAHLAIGVKLTDDTTDENAAEARGS